MVVVTGETASGWGILSWLRSSSSAATSSQSLPVSHLTAHDQASFNAMISAATRIEHTFTTCYSTLEATRTELAEKNEQLQVVERKVRELEISQAVQSTRYNTLQDELRQTQAFHSEALSKLESLERNHTHDIEAIASAKAECRVLSSKVFDLTARLQTTSTEYGELLAVYHQARRHLMALLTEEDSTANAISATRKAYLADELRRRTEVQHSLDTQKEELQRQEKQRDEYASMRKSAENPQDLDRLIEETESVITRLKREIQTKQEQIFGLNKNTEKLQKTIDNSCYSKHALKHLGELRGKAARDYKAGLLYLAHNWNCEKDRLEEEVRNLTLLELLDLRLGGRNNTKRKLTDIGCSPAIIEYFEGAEFVQHVTARARAISIAAARADYESLRSS